MGYNHLSELQSPHYYAIVCGLQSFPYNSIISELHLSHCKSNKLHVGWVKLQLFQGNITHWQEHCSSDKNNIILIRMERTAFLFWHPLSLYLRTCLLSGYVNGA